MSNNKIKLLISIVYGVLLITLLWFLFNPFSKLTGLDELRYIGPSTGRLMERHLSFYEGSQDSPLLEQALHSFLFGSRQRVQDEAINAYQEVLEYFKNHPESTEPWDILNTKARWLITIAELRDHSELVEALTQFDNNPEEEVIAEAVKFAYFDDYQERFSPEVYTGATMVPTGWAKNRLELRINTRLEKTYVVNLLQTRMESRGKNLRQHVMQMTLVIIFIIAFGIYLIIRFKIFSIPTPWKNSILENPWLFSNGIRIALQSAVFGLVIWWILHVISNQFFTPNIATLWSTLFASLPMLWLIHHYLLRANGKNLISAFGLSLKNIKIRDFIYISAALLALDLIGLSLIGWGTWKLGLESHWAHGIHERLVFGPTQTIVFSVINIILWVPILEEIGFRGLLHTTFRTRLSPISAIILNAFLFSALHVESLNGFLSIFWSGLILAYAYEKSHSLLPGIVIHSLGNLLYLSTVLLFYR